MMNRAENRQGILGRLRLSPRVAVWRAFGGWEVAESGEGRGDGTPSNTGGSAKWNILNTTLDWPGCTNYNAVPVRNYRTFEDGANATVATLHLPGYIAILEAIDTPGLSAEDVLRVVATTEWGTSLVGLLNGLAAYQARREFYNGLPIGV